MEDNSTSAFHLYFAQDLDGDGTSGSTDEYLGELNESERDSVPEGSIDLSTRIEVYDIVLRDLKAKIEWHERKAAPHLERIVALKDELAGVELARKAVGEPSVGVEPHFAPEEPKPAGRFAGMSHDEAIQTLLREDASVWWKISAVRRALEKGGIEHGPRGGPLSLYTETVLQRLVQEGKAVVERREKGRTRVYRWIGSDNPPVEGEN